MLLTDDLVSVSVDTTAAAQAFAAHLRNTGEWLEVVAGIDSVVVRFDAAVIDAHSASQLINEALRADIPPLSLEDLLLEIPVVYGGDEGPDLEALCKELGISKAEFIALHTGTEYRVDMVGFTPGFAFIGGLDERLNVPRRKEPRQRVAAGSVGIADGRTGLYALASPGGWTIIGRTPFPLFDPQADNPFPVQAGMRIRFTAVEPDVFEQ